jgi:hypothetical protein
LAVDGSGLPPQVMGFASVLIRFLLICGGSGIFPLSMADKYWPSYCSPAGVRHDEGLTERSQCRFISFMLCARNYLCLMRMDATWVGRDPLACLGYVVTCRYVYYPSSYRAPSVPTKHPLVQCQINATTSTHGHHSIKQ